MAQLLLTAASGAAGAASGIGAALARTVASTVASFAAGFAERLIFGPQKRKVEGPRLESFQVQASSEGAPVLKVYGRARVAGQIIWAANFKETTAETTESAGGKGGRLAASKTTYTEYLYSISLAIGLCEGEIDRVGRVWADGKPFDLSKVNARVYRGEENQTPDAAIEASEGASLAPAFRGLAYIVFEDLPLKDFGNRIPQLSFEIEKSLRENDASALENALTAVTMIPGSGEFVYGTTPVLEDLGEGVTRSQNVNTNFGDTDFLASLDALEGVAPNVKAASLVVSWFGDGTDPSQIALRPGVETAIKTTTPYEWSVGGETRGSAHLISTINDGPAFGGTPADQAVIEAIRQMNTRGLEVMFHPFILIDAPGFPWRGRIAPLADKSAAAASAIATFFGVAARADFSVAGDVVSYNGPAENSFRRMILHYAHLCAAAGGVESFILGSELRGITTGRDASGNYPGVAALVTLAADVRAILGPGVKISYGADWSEYFGHQPGDGTGDVFFHLDDFWASADVDFIGVDNYMPLSDWRDGFAHIDALAGEGGPNDRDYLQSQIKGGEGFDYFYASDSDRDGQIRSPISDGAYGEPWIYGYKDLWSWWATPHHNRPAGVRDAGATQWTPESKPFRFTEIGCPAVDKGANQPNVFVDEKSTESALPYFSNGRRDDFGQRRFLEAHADFWRTGDNPVSSVYGAAMVDPDRLYVYAWDARPFPDFPARQSVWSDGPNWEKGHWLTGRLGRAPLDLLVDALAQEAKIQGTVDTSAIDGVITGYVIDRPLSPREMIDPLAAVFQFDMIEGAAGLRFQPRGRVPVATFTLDDLVGGKAADFSISLAHDVDLPAAFRLGFLDETADFAVAVAEARDPRLPSSREAGADIPAVLPRAEAEARARSILADAWVMREACVFTMPPSALEIEPGDAVTFQLEDGATRDYRITEIVDGEAREVEAVRVSSSVYEAPVGSLLFDEPAPPQVFGAPVWELMDLPLLGEADDAGAPDFAAFADPWPGAVALYRSAGDSDPALSGVASARAQMGAIIDDLPPGVSGRWDRRPIKISLVAGALAARDEETVLAGANAMAVKSLSGEWEIIQFKDALLDTDGNWLLSNILRGQAGSEAEALAGASAGARVVILNAAVSRASFAADLRGIDFDWQAGPDVEFPGSSSFSKKSLTLAARGLKPLSPVHLKAAREGGDIRLTWVRRTRSGGDSWEGEVPLAEAYERYHVTIFDGASPSASTVRTAESSAPDYLYTAADIDADFGPGGVSASITVEIAQISDRTGPGTTKRRTIAV